MQEIQIINNNEKNKKTFNEILLLDRLNLLIIGYIEQNIILAIDKNNPLIIPFEEMVFWAYSEQVIEKLHSPLRYGDIALL